GFFRRIVSSRNIGGACAHSVPLEMTPQTRNTCQWCRLKKCCAVNMGRQRSKLGRRAKLRLRGRLVRRSSCCRRSIRRSDHAAGCQSAATQLSGIMTSTFWTILIRNDANSNLSCVKTTQQQQKQQQQQPPPPPSLLEGRLSGRQVASQLMQQGAGSGGVGPLTYPSPPEPVTPPTPPHWQQTPASVKCLKLISRQGTGWRSSMPDAASSSNSRQPRALARIPIPGANRSVAGSPASAPAVATPDTARAPKKVWLEKSCLMATPLAMICRRLAGPQRAAELEDLHNTLSFNNSVSHLILTAIDKFLQEPSPADEGEVLHTLVDYIPQLMLRIVAFSRNIFGGTSSQSMPEPAPQQQQQHFETHRDRVSVSSCSDALTDSDKKRLIVHTASSWRFLQFGWTSDAVGSCFSKFFDVSRKWELTS
uniref:Nuclear receptor domain-containing protein n=1 Tax=Macrostomum lignano TaxID=282301 RepID=A0A1I8FMZ0_9PLAT